MPPHGAGGGYWGIPLTGALFNVADGDKAVFQPVPYWRYRITRAH